MSEGLLHLEAAVCETCHECVIGDPDAEDELTRNPLKHCAGRARVRGFITWHLYDLCHEVDVLEVTYPQADYQEWLTQLCERVTLLMEQS